MHFRIRGFSFIELMLCLAILSVGLNGFLVLQKNSIQLTNQLQHNFEQQMQRIQCFELHFPLSQQCDPH